MKEIIGIFVISFFVLVGCTYPSTTYEEIKTSSPPQKDIYLTENEPQVEAKTVVENKNSPKESEPTEEILEKIICTDECSQSTCEGLYYIGCVVGADECNEEQSKKKIIGECDVECLDDSDC